MTLFESREEAALLLARKLARHGGENPLILAIPRGAVPMGRRIADALGGDLDVVLVHKLGAPGNPEYAIGAVAETGEVVLSDAAEELGVPPAWVEGEAARQLAGLRERWRLLCSARTPVDPAGRTAIVVDDGVATGQTMIAALRHVRARRPRRLVVAVAVAPPETVRKLAEIADEVVCLETPTDFWAVGQFFRDFRQVTDEEVLRELKKKRQEVPEPVPAGIG